MGGERQRNIHESLTLPTNAECTVGANNEVITNNEVIKHTNSH